MATASPFATIQVAYSPSRRVCDVVIAPTSGGRGTVAIDTSPASALLIAFGTDRRARDDDELPDGGTGLLSRRGWCGTLVRGDELGGRLWLLSRAKQTRDNLDRAASYAAEAVADIATRHNVTIDTSSAIGGPRTLLVTAQVEGVRFTLPVAIA